MRDRGALLSTRTIKSNCHYCGYLCGFIATVEDTEDGERLRELKPDPSRYPYDERTANGCQRWRVNLSEIDAPTRVNYPLRRLGERGSGQWERVSWDEALDDIAARLSALAQEHGAQTLASAIGGPHATYWPLHRFMNLFGSPNNMGIGQICWNMRVWMESVVFGWPIEEDINPEVTGAVFLWGTNPAESDNSVLWRTLRTMDKEKTALVVIDPRTTRTARIATLHLAPHPGTDCTLALALIREIIATKRYREDFVRDWTSGFDALKAHVEPYTLAHAEQVTGVPAAAIAEAARIFSQTAPTALHPGRGLDQLGRNSAPTHHAICILRALTGDIERLGAAVLGGRSSFISEYELEMSAALSVKQRALGLNKGYSVLQSYENYERAQLAIGRFGRNLPLRYLTSAHPDLVWHAMLTGQPYPVRALICMATNPLITYADTQLVHEALLSLDLLVVLDYHLTPTAQLADYVLPAAGAFERPLIQMQGGVADVCYGGAAAVKPYYERREDYSFFRELGCRLGQGKHWQQVSLKEAIEHTLAPVGMSWQEWTDTGMFTGPRFVGSHAYWDETNGVHWGFGTPSGRIELASTLLEELGCPALPAPAPVSSDPAYPLTLLTGARKQPFWGSSLLDVEEFRRRHPDPTVQMSAHTLAQAGLIAGSWVELRTPHSAASVRLKAEVADMLDGIVSAEYGWWFPEEAAGEPGLSGAWLSNINVLTSCAIADCEPLVGTWLYNGIPCKVNPVANSAESPAEALAPGTSCEGVLP
ncbi:MAG: molybdopterin-dependent oxidoreductase [Coriobacteriales bacterium]|nr:molybdopterin-dependent oxidoreductase [Coriobacteriales bacterium]